MVRVPLGSLCWLLNGETLRLGVGANDARDLQLAVEFLLEYRNDDLVCSWRIDALCQGARGVPQDEGFIAHSKNAGFREHDLSDLIAAANCCSHIGPRGTDLRCEILGSCTLLWLRVRRVLRRFRLNGLLGGCRLLCLRRSALFMLQLLL